MRHYHRAALIGVAIFATPAWAGETPLYEAAPAWVVPAQLPAKIDATSPAMLLFDTQQRVEGGKLHAYLDIATRMATTEMLSRNATITFPWAPDKGDLIVHELSVLRRGAMIDLLAQGQRFTVLRREQMLEQREMTGMLTATLPVEGLQVGDVLRFRSSVTSTDKALAGHVQSANFLLVAPLRAGAATMSLSWPASHPPKWKIMAQGISATPVRKGDFEELRLVLPAPKQPEMPSDAPARFQHPAMLELSSFGVWAEVSKVMAALYSTDGKIAEGSPVAAEVAAIMKAETDPVRRAQRALEVVQDRIRYLAIGMDGGNYIPKDPAATWELRYGDCKAKSLLLLSMLRAMGIDAEAVAVHTELGDLVPERLPSALAFNHIIVRADIDGKSLWLDGTASGSRLADINDTPPFGYGLPVRVAGAELLKIETRADARPLIDMTIDADESSSLDIPSAFTATAVVRGELANMFTLADANMDDTQKREAIWGFFQGWFGEAQLSDARITANQADGEVTLSARGVVSSLWWQDERRRKRDLSKGLEHLEFAPDRARSAWKTIPVAGGAPEGMRYSLTLRLPEGGRGYTLEGEPNFQGTMAGYQVNRTTRLENGVLKLEERIDSTGIEVAAAAIPAERDKVAQAKAQAPRIVAPENARMRWQVSTGGKNPGTQLKAVDAVFAKAMAEDSESASAYMSRASFRSGTGDLAGAQADLSKAIELEPSEDLLLQRAGNYYEVGDLKAALADMETALELDPSSVAVNQRVAEYKAELGDLDDAIAFLDEKIELGGDDRNEYLHAKAVILGEFGDPAAAVALYDQMIADRPGVSVLLNGRCWVKGSRAIMLDGAAGECTSALELGAASSVSTLHSRATVWYRLGRFDDALRDLDAALAQSPGHAHSRYLRGIVLAKMGRSDEGAAERAIALRLRPSLQRDYKRYGITS